MRTTSILTLQEKWSGAQQGFEVLREGTQGGKKTVDVVYGLTQPFASGSQRRASPGLGTRARADRKGLHDVRDVTLGEDACWVRKGSAPRVLAALRNAVVDVLADVDSASRPEALEWLQMHPEEAKKLIGLACPQQWNGAAGGRTSLETSP